jgi:putative phage-type endonuclease
LVAKQKIQTKFPSEEMVMQQNTSAWLEWRRHGVGASEAAAILGVCPYNTPLDIWKDKVGKGVVFEGSSATQRGQDLEGKARAKYELLTMEDVPPAIAVHPKYDMLRASLDGFRADGKLILEIKCPGEASHAAAMTGIVPEHYGIQMQHQMAVTGADMGHYFSYSYKDHTHALVEVLPDLELQGRIVAAVLEFWELVKSNTPPPLTDRDFKDVAGDARLEALVNRIRTEHKDLKKPDIDRLKAEAVALGGHNKIVCGDVKISAVNRMGKFSYHKLTIATAKGEVA